MMYLKQAGSEYSFCDEAAADYAVVPVSEYNGLKNALRIVRERAIQQIDRSKADIHGYRLLRAEYEQIRTVREDVFAWRISKSTPYSAKMDVHTAKLQILQDLKEFYNFVRDEDISYVDERENFTRLSFEMLCRGIPSYQGWVNSDRKRDFIVNNDSCGRTLLKLFNKHDGVVAFNIHRLSYNYSSGVYEVTYWASEPI